RATSGRRSTPASRTTPRRRRPTTPTCRRSATASSTSCGRSTAAAAPGTKAGPARWARATPRSRPRPPPAPRLVSRRVVPGGSVQARDVLLHHPARAEAGGRSPHGAPHEREPASRQPLGVAVVVGRRHLVLQ